MHILSARQRRTLARIAAAAVLLTLLHWVPVPESFPLWTLYLMPYLIIGGDVVRRAVGNIARGQVFDENFLMTLATAGAFFTAEYAEAVFVMLFYQVGELFQSYAVDQSRKSITALMDIRPDYANMEGPDGQMEQVDPEDVSVGGTPSSSRPGSASLWTAWCWRAPPPWTPPPSPASPCPGRWRAATTSSPAASTCPAF